MSLEVFYVQDILNALAAAEQATRDAGASGEYLRGYLSALNTLALTFGVSNILTWRVVVDAEYKEAPSGANHRALAEM